MAKKTKRKVSAVASSTPASSEVMDVHEAVTPTPAAPSYASPARTFGRRATTAAYEFNPDYTYVVNDLKRMGILAGSFFVLLVALSFIVPIILK